MKKILLLLVVFLLASCNQQIVYNDDKAPLEIYDEIKGSIESNDEMKILDKDILFEISDKEIPFLKDFVIVKANDSTNLNEIGIFRVEEGKAAEMKSKIDEYVINKQKGYRMMSYYPEEMDKVDFSTIRNYGNYIIYSFLNEDDTIRFYEEIEKAMSV